MKIKFGMILAAGLGKRMLPLTLTTPKPLIKINDITLLERSINLLIISGIQEISINVHYLSKQIKDFINDKKFDVKIHISDESNLLLDTGGGVAAGTKHFGNEPFFVVNPDTLWDKSYLGEVKELEAIHQKYQKPVLLVVNKSQSFDQSFKGDFNLVGNKISRDSENKFIFTGLQITNRKYLISQNSKIFSMNKIWTDLIDSQNLLGLESKKRFFHLNTFEMFEKISDLKITD
mgnify:FL=1